MDQIRNLLWLRLRLTFGFYRKRAAAVTTLLITIPLALGFALSAYFAGLVALWSLPPETNRQLLNGGLTMLYVSWLFFPLAGIALNQSFDVSKLLQYPVSPRRIFTANILGSAFDPYTLTFIIALTAIPVGLASGGVSAALLVCLVIVFVFHTISLSQALLTLLWGLMKSRRIRDFWKVAAAVFGMVFWAVYNIASRRMSADTVAYALNARPARFTRFLPSGWTADAALALHEGDTTGFAWRTALLLLVCAATVLFAGALLSRMYTGDIELAAFAPKDRPRERPVTARRPGRPGRRNIFDVLPPAAAAMARKEWITYGRDPVVKIEVLRGLFVALVMPFVLFLSGGNSSLSEVSQEFGGPVIIGYVFLMAFVATMSTSLNLLAREREGITLLAALPTPRMLYLIGKNAAAMAIIVPTLLLVSVAACAYTARWDLLAAVFLGAVGAALLTMGATNLASVWFPTPLPQKGQNPFTSSRGGGCMGALLGMLSMPVFIVVVAPMPAAVLVPAVLGAQNWLWLSVPASMAYAALIYWALTAISARSLVKREPEVLATLLRLPA